VIDDSSAPMTSRQRRTAEQEARATLDSHALKLRKRYDDNAAAGRLIDDDGDEHGCPTKGSRAGCRVNFTLDPDELPL
jgi:hypothetical protein